MKILIALALAAIAVLGTGGYLARARLARLPAIMESAIERCPPIQAMRKLEEQNTEMIDLLRDQNTLLRKNGAAAPAVAEPV